MVREAERRKRKYEKNVDGDQVGRAIKAQKDIMLDQEKTYFPQITLIEEKTKALCEAQGIATYLIPQYLNFAREMYSKAKRFSQATLANEAQYLLNKWQSRGLLGSKLVEIARLFGVTPTHIEPTVSKPITLFGGNAIEPNIWSGLGFMDISNNSSPTITNVPEGKTFKLWAIGQMYCGNAAKTNLRLIDYMTMTVVHELGLGVIFEEYFTPYTCEGPCLITIEAFQNTVTPQLVAGFFVFTIE